MGALGDGEQDDLKKILLEGNPFFLGITLIVSLLHSVFDMLAFKNDIGFWKNKKNVEGLSVRTISINCFCQVRLPMPSTPTLQYELRQPLTLLHSHANVHRPNGNESFHPSHTTHMLKIG